MAFVRSASFLLTDLFKKCHSLFKTLVRLSNKSCLKLNNIYWNIDLFYFKRAVIYSNAIRILWKQIQILRQYFFYFFYFFECEKFISDWINNKFVRQLQKIPSISVLIWILLILLLVFVRVIQEMFSHK